MIRRIRHSHIRVYSTYSFFVSYLAVNVLLLLVKQYNSLVSKLLTTGAAPVGSVTLVSCLLFLILHRDKKSPVHNQALLSPSVIVPYKLYL
jgi:hypothetical protein